MKPTKKRFCRWFGLNLQEAISIALRVCSSSLAAGLIWLTSGCSSVPSEPPNLAQLEQGGLTVGVRPLTTRSEVKQTFKIDLLARDVLPVRVKAENRNPSASYVIAKDKIFIVNQTGQMTNTAGQVARELAT